MLTLAFNCSTREAEAGDFYRLEVSLILREFQDCHSYTKRPGLENKQKPRKHTAWKPGAQKIGTEALSHLNPG